MSKFDFMGFGYDGGRDEMFVAHANKYTKEQTLELCKKEYQHRFEETACHRLPGEKKLRVPTTDDVISTYCAFRFGVSSEWPDGCYTFVGKNEPGAFLVYVIYFDNLKERRNEDYDNKMQI